jgi:hypothetical protein
MEVTSGSRWIFHYVPFAGQVAMSGFISFSTGFNRVILRVLYSGEEREKPSAI